MARPVTTYIARVCSLAAAADVFGGAELCVVFSHMVSRVGSGIELCPFLSIFLPTFKGMNLNEFNRKEQYPSQAPLVDIMKNG